MRERKAPEEVYVSAELIAIVAAAIALGTALLASMRGVRQDARDRHNELRADMAALDSRLTGEMKTLGSELRSEMKSLGSELRGEMETSGTGLRSEVTSLDGSLRAEMSGLRDDMNSMEGRMRDQMQTGFKEVNTRVVNLGDRLSKVEGIIEGVFWGARNPPAEKPGEGVA